MPNWCENKILIESQDLARLEAILEELKGPLDVNFYMKPSEVAIQQRMNPDFNADYHLEQIDFSFQKLVPIPEEVAQADNPTRLNSSEVYDGPRFSHSNDAHVAYWNTKWPPSQIFSEIIEDTHLGTQTPLHVLTYEFSTAWSAPIPVFEAMAKKFPDVEICCYAYEPAMNYGLSYEKLTDEYELIDVSDDDIRDFAELHFGYDQDFFDDDEDDDF